MAAQITVCAWPQARAKNRRESKPTRCVLLNWLCTVKQPESIRNAGIVYAGSKPESWPLVLAFLMVAACRPSQPPRDASSATTARPPAHSQPAAPSVTVTGAPDDFELRPRVLVTDPFHGVALELPQNATITRCDSGSCVWADPRGTRYVIDTLRADGSGTADGATLSADEQAFFAPPAGAHSWMVWRGAGDCWHFLKRDDQLVRLHCSMSPQSLTAIHATCESFRPAPDTTGR